MFVEFVLVIQKKSNKLMVNSFVGKISLNELVEGSAAAQEFNPTCQASD